MISITYTINTYIRFCKLISITYLAPYLSHGITTILDNLIFLNDFYLSNQLMQISILFICFYICKIRFQSLIKYKSEGKVAESFMGSHSRNLVTTEFWDEKTASENEWWTAKKVFLAKVPKCIEQRPWWCGLLSKLLLFSFSQQRLYGLLQPCCPRRHTYRRRRSFCTCNFVQGHS